jgi:ketosteroid isomerase-like protein
VSHRPPTRRGALTQGAGLALAATTIQAFWTAPVQAATSGEASTTMAGQSESDFMRVMAAKEQIKELRARYCWHAARGDYDRIVEIFTPDGMFEVMANGQRIAHRGREAIHAFLAKSMVPGMVFPTITNEVITVEGDTAYGTCAMCSAAPNNTFSGYYHDRAVLYEGRWLFTERRFFFYTPVFERSGLALDGTPETGLAAQHDRKPGEA